MNWEDFKIEQYLWEYSDRLVENSKKLVDETEIYQPEGLSTSQIHNLLQEARQAKSIDRLRYFVDDEAKRSLPKEPEEVTKAEGEGWKFGWKKDSEGEHGRFFSDKLKESFDELEDFADGFEMDYEYEENRRKIGVMMARRFLTYLNWYVSWKRMKLQEMEEVENV